MASRLCLRRSLRSANFFIIVTFSVLGVIQVVRANLLEELEQSQAAPVPAASSENLTPQGSEVTLNSAEGLKYSSDVASGSPQPSGSGMGGCNSNGPLLTLAPGAYIQFKVAVPPGFLARMDDTPDGGKVIVVISPEPPCPKCGAQQYGGLGSTATNSFDGAPPPPQLPQGSSGNMKVQSYQESAQMVQRSGQSPSAAGSPQQQYASGPDQALSSSQMYMKNSAYRKVQVGTANQMPSYQARNTQNFPPPPQPPQSSFQQRLILPPPPPPPQPQMMQRMARPPSQYQQQQQQQQQPMLPSQYQQQPMSPGQYQQQPMPSSQYQQSQQAQYAQVNSAPEYPQQQQQIQSSQYIPQTDTNSYQQQSSQFQPSPPSQQPAGPGGALEKFHTALRSLDDESE